MKPDNSSGPAALVLALALLLAPAANAQDNTAAPEQAPAAAPDTPVTTARAEPAETAASTEATIEAKIEAKPTIHPFTAMAGSWSGGGTISLTSGTRERLRCRAQHTAGHGKSLTLNIRCASDSYKFELSSNVSERRGQISGNWSEASNGVSGSISGHMGANRISAVASGTGFTAGIAVTTNGNQQSVSITPQGVHIAKVQIALSRR